MARFLHLGRGLTSNFKPMKTVEKPTLRTKNVHLLLGLAMALSISLFSLEWGVKTHLSEYIGQNDDFEVDYETEFPPVTIREYKLPEPPKAKSQPQPAAPIVVTQIIVADNSTPDDQLTDPSQLPGFDHLDFSGFLGEEDIIDDIPRQPWMLTEKPSFPGGDPGFRAFLDKNLNYPRRPLDQGIKGLVTLDFVIGKDGKIIKESVTVLRSPHPDLSKEAIRVLCSMPAWNPGKQGVYPVPVNFKLPISFNFR